MTKDMMSALALEAKQVALAANRLCLSLKASDADVEVRLKAGEAFTALGSIYISLSKVD